MPLVVRTSSVQAEDMDRRPDFDTENRRGGLAVCPDCGGSHTITLRDIDIVAFLCEDCGTCWRIELGYLHRIRPSGGSLAEE
jgi:hypothetical protein